MKFLFIFLLIVSNAFAIYGVDSRKDYFEIKDPAFKELMGSVSRRVYMDELKGWTFKKYWTVITNPLREKNICSSEKFVKQQSFRESCSSVLIGEDLLLTAGNCTTEHYCWNDLFYWMFDYHHEKETIGQKHLKKNFYKCDKILKRVFDRQNGISLTLMRLKKKVKNRKIIKLSNKKILNRDEELIVIGNIKGSSTKYSDGAFVSDQDENLMIVNSDISGESLGSAVFNKRSLELEGILIYGTQSYIDNGKCLESNNMRPEQGQELVIKSRALRKFIKDFI